MYVIFPAQDVVDWCYFSTTLVSPTALNKMSADCSLKELSHPAHNEALKVHNTVTFKLVKTVSDFAQQLATVHEQHAEELQLLVETFRKRNADLRRERPLYPSMLFASWETFLQEVEVDSQTHSDIASILGRHVSVPILERTFHRKVQARKVFTHRESCETILNKTEELLFKCHKDYSDAYEKLLTDRSPNATEAYVDTHNVYVQQLHAANAMVDEYHSQTLPQLLEEFEEIYLDLSDTVARSVLEGAEIIATKAQEQHTRYDALCNLSRGVNSKTDLLNYTRTLNMDTRVSHEAQKHEFTPPQLEASDANEIPVSPAPIPVLKNEVVIDKSLIVPMRSKYEALKKESLELENKIRGLQEASEALIRLQQRSLDSSLFNKANEIQEDISLKRFDVRVAQIHVAAVKAQIDLLAAALENKGDNNVRDRKMSSSSTGSMKNKWLKAFKSLKSGASGSGSERKTEKKENLSTKDNGNANALENAHIFQEYTYKKITACDLCHEILRGHTRQGMRCKMCKLNVHVDCQDKAGRCQPKPRLLRRQKSTSEIETRVMDKEDDTTPLGSSSESVFSLLNPFGSTKNKKRGSPTPTIRKAPQSPVHSRRLLSTRAVRMSSVDLPDDNEKSLSSASTSPCPSPKPHRLLPTNLYVVLYTFKSRHQDELDLKAGYTVTVIDTTDPDWWKGKCLGKLGYFPSKYVAKLNPGERPLQVTHNLQVTDNGDNGLKLLRDQIVIQVSEENAGMIPIRCGDRQGLCPLKYLQEV